MILKIIVLKLFLLIIIFRQSSEFKFMRRIQAVGDPYYKILMFLGFCKDTILYNDQKIWGKVPMNRVLDIYYKSNTPSHQNSIMFFSIPWYIPKSETIKLRSCRNLIEHYFGNFLEKLTLEQLSVNLYNGIGTVSDVALDCDALNNLGDELKWPLQVVKGHMQDITVKVPWSNVFKEDSILKVDGLSLTLQPKVRTEPVKSFLKWLMLNWQKWSSKQIFMSNKNSDEFETHIGQGEEMFAESIEAILKRLKVKLENTKIRIEHLPQHINRGFALDIYIRSIDCYDEAISEFKPVGINPEQAKTYLLDTYLKKKIKLEGVTLYTDEFHINRRALKDIFPESQRFMVNYNLNKHVSDGVYNEMKRNVPTTESSIIKGTSFTKSNDTYEGAINRLGPIMFAIMNGKQELTLSLKHSGNMENLSIEAETVGPFVIVLSPKQLDAVIRLLKTLNKSKSKETSVMPVHSESLMDYG